MTPAEFVEEIRKLHEPHLPRLVSVLNTQPDYDESGEWHVSSLDEQAAALDWWCDGCNWLASKCRVAHLLVLVDYGDHTQTCEDLDQRPEDVA